MKIYCAKDYEQASRITANILAAQIILKPDCVLGLATGSTPIGAYENLIKRYEAGDLDFSSVHSINLDEYRGLTPSNSQSYRYFMNTHLFDHVNIDKKNTFDIERFLSTKLKPKPSEVYDVFEIDVSEEEEPAEDGGELE